MIFLTYNDNYSGIYKSQVIDVCIFLHKQFHVKVKLVAFVSIRNYFWQKKLINSDYADSIIFPMFPKIKFWKVNSFFLFFICLFTGNKKKIWARGPFACNLALNMKSIGLTQKVLFDARGAYLSEFTEYNVTQSEIIKKSICLIEKRALINSNSQLAVSQKLIEWWKEQYNFTPTTCFKIPCTISTHFTLPLPLEKEIEHARENMGFSKEDIVLVYSGSSSGWQSFNLVDIYLFELFSKKTNIKLIFLSDEIPDQSRLFSKFKNRIITKWVTPNEVRSLLIMADYGLLIREESITNKVASPVKFAEYLSCGLQVIISENIGDFTNFVIKNNCGILLDTESKITHVPYQQKINNNKLAITHFAKESQEVVRSYEKLFATF